MRRDLIDKVLNDLKDILPYADNIIFEDCHALSYVGRYYFKKNKIVISDYITDEQDYMATVAHELIHAAGVCGHGLEFKEWMNKINSLNLGYVVYTNAGKDNGIEEIRKIREEKREKREKTCKKYIVWCDRCGYNYISSRKYHKLSHYCCPQCMNRLRQKLYVKGNTTITRILS